MGRLRVVSYLSHVPNFVPVRTMFVIQRLSSIESLIQGWVVLEHEAPPRLVMLSTYRSALRGNKVSRNSGYVRHDT